METVPPSNEERSMQISSSLESAAARLARTTIGVDGKAEDRGAERGELMLSARLPPAQLRCVLTKRKFEEVECSVAESNGLTVVRPRRELREGNIQETVVLRSSASQTMSPVEQLNCGFDAEGIVESSACDVNDGLEDNFNKVALQVPHEADLTTSDKLQSGAEVMRMNTDYSDGEVQKMTTADVRKAHCSTNKEEIKDTIIDEKQGEFLMDWSSSPTSVDSGPDFLVCLSSTSTTEKLEESESTVSVIDGNVLQLSEDEEHKVQFVDTGEIGYNGRYIDTLEKDKEKEEGFANSLSKCLTEAADDSNMCVSAVSYAEIPSCCNAQDQSILNESLSRDASVEEVNKDDTPSESRRQFFVRTILDRPTIVLHADLGDTVESVHRQIQMRTGLPSYEQRLIYCGKQLQREQTLAVYNVTNDATLQLVGRMRSTALPHSWQLVSDLVATIRLLCATNATQKTLQDKVCSQVKEFLKMAAKTIPSSEHMQVFQLAGAGATLALVMLMLSPVESNHKCAEEAIKLFTSANEEYLPNHIHCYCAPILLEFCKLFAKSAPNHNLYTVCRSSLASLLDTVGFAHGSPYFHDAKASTIVQEFSPFVSELSIRLSSNLRWTTGACALKDKAVDIQHVKEGQDFTAFVIPLCKAMEACKVESNVPTNGVHVEDKSKGFQEDLCEKQALMTSCSVSLKEEIGSHKWLRTVFKKLLLEIESCLEAVEDVVVAPGTSSVDDHPFSWAPFLVVLKGLHAIAKLYDDAMEELLLKLQLRRSALNILIKQLRWHDDHFWLLDYGFLLDFESKKRLVMAMLPEPQDDHDERQEVIIQRSQLLAESFELLAYAECEVLQGGISVEFINEEATGPGVLREWFSLICREIFNPQNALFLSCPKDRRRFFPNPASGVNPGHLTYFKFCGRVIALALMHKVQVDIVFDRIFFMQLTGQPVSWEDVQDADPDLYSSCKKILDMDADFLDSDALGLTFVTEVEELGSRKVVELCPGGRDLVVGSNNRHKYVKLLIQRRYVTSITEQVKCFAQGFSDLLVNSTHQQFLRALEPEDMDLMLYGYDRDICVDDWKVHTEYHDYSESDNTIIWFWQVVEGMTMEQRRKLLFFSTSVTHLPAEGFSGLSSKFHIHRAYTDLSWLPTAHTCFYQLVLPPYPCFEVMHARLHAITEGHIAEGFGFA